MVIRFSRFALARRNDDRRGGAWAWPWAAVALAVTWNLWELRATLPGQFRNDSALHEQMVRFAAARIGAGHDPLTSWFPTWGWARRSSCTTRAPRRS